MTNKIGSVIILIFFFLYYALGIFLYSNFYDWTWNNGYIYSKYLVWIIYYFKLINFLKIKI